MRSANTAYTGKNTSPVKEPRFVVEISFDSAHTDLHYFVAHSDTALPGGASATVDVLQSLSGTSQSIQPLQGRSTIGSFSFRLVDLNGAITSLFNIKLGEGKGLKNNRVRVYSGYEGLAWSEYELVTTVRVDKSVIEKGGAYQINCSDIQRAEKEDIFRLNSTELTKTITADQTTIPVVDNTVFEFLEHGTSYADAPSQTVIYFRIEEEIIRATGTGSGPNGPEFTGCVRGVLGTSAVEHQIDDQTTNQKLLDVDEVVYLEMPGPKLAYALLTGDLYNQPGEKLPSNWHLDISGEFVRTADFVNAGIDLWDTSDDTKGRIVTFIGEERQEGKKFIEEQIMLLLGAFMPVHANGELGFKRMTRVMFDASPYVTLDSGSILSASDFTHDISKIYGTYNIVWGWDFIDERFTRLHVVSVPEISSTYQDAGQTTLRFRGLSSGRHSQSTLDNIFKSLIDRYAGPPGVMTVTVGLAYSGLEVGDIVRIKLPIRDFTTGQPLDRSFEVQSVQVNWITGQVTLNLFGSSTQLGEVNLTGGTVAGDAFYTSIGTDMATLPGTSETGGVLHFTINQTLFGGSDINDSASIYYYDGDVQIDAGVTLTCRDNVQLRINGNIQTNGTLTTEGEGHNGGSGSIYVNGITGVVIGGSDPAIRGIEGFFGPSYCMGSLSNYGFTTNYGARRYIFDDGVATEGSKYEPSNPVEGKSLDAIELSWSGDTLLGIPADLRGTSGPAGFKPHRKTLELGPDGGDGGASGGGLVVVCKTWNVGVGGKVSVSGDDGQEGATQAYAEHFIFSGSGGGGMPGALLILQDGDGIYPSLDRIEAFAGACPAPAGGLPYSEPVSGSGNSYYFDSSTIYAPSFFESGVPYPRESKIASAVRIIKLPSRKAPQSDVPKYSQVPLGILLNEIPNTPPTPLGNISTVEVTVTPPSDNTYDYANIYYRVIGGEWFFAGPASDELPIELASDGSTYEFQARSVSINGNESSSGPTAQITLTDTVTPGDDEGLDQKIPVHNITGLELDGQANGDEFGGKDARFTWNKSTFGTALELGNEPSGLGASGGAVSPEFKDYVIEMYDISGNLLRTEYTVDNFYVYTHERNSEDGGPRRTFEIVVYARNSVGQLSARPGRLTVSNTAPALPTVSVDPAFTAIHVQFGEVDDLDAAGYQIWLSKQIGFTVGADNLAASGPDASVALKSLSDGEQITTGTWYYLKYAAYDAFGKDILNISGEIAVKTESITTNEFDTTPPTKPSGVVLTTHIDRFDLTSTARIDAGWDASSDDVRLAHYLVEFWSDKNPTRSVQPVPGADTQTAINGVVIGDTYFVRVAAVDGAGNQSDWSGEASILVTDGTAAPSNVTGATAVGGLDKVVLNWTNPIEKNFLYTRVFRGLSAGFTADASSKIADIRSDSLIDSNVVNGASYYYKFQTFDNSGNFSAVSGAVGPAIPNKITDLNISAYFEAAAIGNAYILDLDAAKITAGTLDADRIGANTVEASKLNVTTLSSITADVGTLTGGVIQGVIVRTAASGQRVVMSSSNGLEGWNSSSVRTFHLDVDGSGYLGSASDIQWDSSGVVTVPGSLVAGDIIGNIIRTATSGWRVEMGPVLDGGTTYLLRAHNGVSTVFSIDDSGAAEISAKLTVGSGSSGIATFTDAGGLATKNSADWQTEVGGSGKPANNADVTQTVIDGGLITTGYIQLSTAGNIRSGQTAYNVGTGFWLGNDAGTPKFSIGVAGGKGVTWNGSALTVQGKIQTAASGQRIVVNDSINELEFFANPPGTGGLRQIAGIGINSINGDDVVIWAGDDTSNTVGLLARSSAESAVLGASQSGYGLHGYAGANGISAALFSESNSKAHLSAGYNFAAIPSHNPGAGVFMLGANDGGWWANAGSTTAWAHLSSLSDHQAEDGWVELGGIAGRRYLLQFGVVNIPGSASATFNFPTAFTVCRNVVVSYKAANSGVSNSPTVEWWNATQLKIWNNNGITHNVSWQAIGYLSP